MWLFFADWCRSFHALEIKNNFYKVYKSGMEGVLGHREHLRNDNNTLTY